MERQEIMGSWPKPDPKEEARFTAYIRHLVECEEFDRTVCSRSLHNGLAMPFTSHEMVECRRNSRKSVRALEVHLGRSGLEQVKVVDRRRAGKMSHHAMVEFLAYEDARAERDE